PLERHAGKYIIQFSRASTRHIKLASGSDLKGQHERCSVARVGTGSLLAGFSIIDGTAKSRKLEVQTFDRKALRDIAKSPFRSRLRIALAILRTNTTQTGLATDFELAGKQ